MDYDTFIGEVQNRGHLPSREDAVQATRITLETLSERIEPATAENLGAQLPAEIGRHLETVDTLERFDWDGFVERIVEKGEYDPDTERADAVHHARIVLDVVDESASSGAVEDLRDQLPASEEWNELFELVDQEEKPVEEEQRSA